MKATVKSGYSLLRFQESSFIIEDELVLYLKDKFIFDSFSFHKKDNSITIKTKNGVIKIILSDDISKINLKHYFEDQLIFKILK